MSTELPSTIAPPPAPRKRWIVVLVASLVVILGITVAGTVLFFTNTWPPFEATSDFTDQLEDGNVDGAYAQMCDRLQNVEDREAFESFADVLFSRMDTISVDPFDVDRDGNTASVGFTVHTPDDHNIEFELLVVSEGGDWKPCGFGP